MRRTILILKTSLAVAAGCALIGSTVGCLHSRTQARPSAQTTEIPSLIDPDEGTRTLINNQNRAARAPGGWSNQANEIEKNLGVQ